ncbi:MAG: recombination mediator RecR [Bacteroidota bacterium]|nr:recombination mediator RecR [Bacteroidota bacterium]
MNQPFPSTLLEEAVNEFSKLPGIGKKTALRLVLHLLKQPAEQVARFGNSVIRLKNEVCYCRICHNISDQERCSICSDSSRNSRQICVVENIREVMAVENTGQYNGVYHVLGGLISPMDGVGPSNLEIESLVDRITREGADEVIMALPATMEGDTTAFYVYRKLAPVNIPVTTIARGIAVGDELEYADEITLGRSILNRITYKG